MIEKARGREGIIQPPFLSLPPPSEVWCIWPVIYRLYGKYSPVQQRALIQELYLSHRDVFHISQDERESERFTITFSDRDNSPSVSQTHYGTISLEYKCQNELNYDHSKETLFSEKALSFPAHHNSADKTEKIKLKIKYTDIFNFNI